MTEFKVGDVVRVRGQDGPPMTVADLDDREPDPRVTCIWFDQHDRLRQASIPPNLLIARANEHRVDRVPLVTPRDRG